MTDSASAWLSPIVLAWLCVLQSHILGSLAALLHEAIFYCEGTEITPM